MISLRASVLVRASALDLALSRNEAASAARTMCRVVLAVLVAMLTLVKGYGKAEGTDAYSWDIAGDGTGAVTVNGVPLPVGPSK